MASVTEVRAAFLEYFASKGHSLVPSSSLVPHNDPTLMFANAGMNQFKNIFTGAEKPVSPRAASSQKCVRAGGKHNDLDNVGYTARHHTFFEMLGNFSFGDYFKEEAIFYGWELVTKQFGLNPEKLCVTVYHTDDEAFSLWKKIAGLPDHKIIRIPTNDNFWTMGDTGPCGPCSEIFYDHGEHIPGGPPGSPGEDGDRFIEIWNLVFMQYEQKDKDTRISLPKPSIDTGMGLERISAVMQGVHDNYDIDLFKTIIANIKSHVPSQPATEAPFRVIADHLRASGFLIADGVLPSNEGRGYVLRRIMRRAMRYAHQLGCRDPLMHKLVPTLVNLMGSAYPELVRAQATIVETLKLEEERFKQTLERGLKLLDEERGKISGKTFSGDVAFKLYDTYGFPVDLTADILRADAITIDMPGFDAAMNEQRQRARDAHKGSGDATTQAIWFDVKDRAGSTEFLGYSLNEAQAVIVALVKDGAEVKTLNAGEKGQLIVNQTPFYGESGGQIGDSGSFTTSGATGLVTDTSKPLDAFHVHHISVTKGTIQVGDTVTLSIDVARRARIRANHSATHLLHAALRKLLGEHVTQKGSLVAEDALRFDVAHPKQISRDELDAIEAEVNRLIWLNTDVATKLMTPDEAIEAGAMALFGEKYGDEVRVLSMGSGNFSVELCGGTHVAHTGDIGLFKITSEGAVAAGVRRIEAITQAGAFAYLSGQDATLKSIALDLKIKPEDVAEKVSSLQEEKKKLEKELTEAKKKLAMGGGGGNSEPTSEQIGSVRLVSRLFDELDAKSLRDIAQGYQQKYADSVVVVASNFEGKANIIVAVGKETKADAPALVRAASAAVGGQGGGGKPDFAQAGGPEGDKLESAISAIKQSLAT
jgi:alanyl-tRNA synthetase